MVCNIPFISSIILNILSLATASIVVKFVKISFFSSDSDRIVILQISGIYESNPGEQMANFPASTKVSVMSPNTFPQGHTCTLYILYIIYIIRPQGIFKLKSLTPNSLLLPRPIYRFEVKIKMFWSLIICHI